MDIVSKSATILREAIDRFNPTHIVSMVSGGKDSAASDQVARELGANIDTMQSKAERIEASVLYPSWGKWLNDLEAEAKRIHGFGWGDPFPKPRDPMQADLFAPMCKDCMRSAA